MNEPASPELSECPLCADIFNDQQAAALVCYWSHDKTERILGRLCDQHDKAVKAYANLLESMRRDIPAETVMCADCDLAKSKTSRWRPVSVYYSASTTNH